MARASSCTRPVVSFSLALAMVILCSIRLRRRSSGTTAHRSHSADTTAPYDLFLLFTLPLSSRRATPQIVSLSFCPDDAHIVSASADGTLRTWSIAQGLEVADLRVTCPSIVPAALAVYWAPPTGSSNHIAILATNTGYHLYDVATADVPDHRRFWCSVDPHHMITRGCRGRQRSAIV